MPPRVSVVVPAYRPTGFSALRASIAANLCADAEWIVVDDGSGPAFDAVFEALADTPARVIRYADNRRQGAARNVGLAAAQGDWVKFLDADDQLDHAHLTRLLKPLPGSDDKAIAYARTLHVFEPDKRMVNDSAKDLPAEPKAQFLRMLVRPFLSHCGALFPRDLLLELGGYDESLVTDEDGDLLLRVLRAGFHFIPVADVHYWYIHQSERRRVSTDDDIGKLTARVRTCEKVVESFGGAVPSEVAMALAQRMDKIAMAFWPDFPTEAEALLRRAAALAPGYRPDLRFPLWFLRRVGGPGLMLTAQQLYQKLRGRFVGAAAL